MNVDYIVTFGRVYMNKDHFEVTLKLFKNNSVKISMYKYIRDINKKNNENLIKT